MIKEELIDKIVNLLGTIEDSPQKSFDDIEIEDMILEAGVPITREINLIRAEQLNCSSRLS